MCQAKKDGGNRCAFHHKVEINRLEETKKAFVEQKMQEFLKGNPDVLSDPRVAEEYEEKVRMIRAEPKFDNIVTKDDVLEAHNTAMKAKQLRDKKAEEGETHSIGSSLKSFGKIFRKKNNGSAQTAMEAVLAYADNEAITKNPEAAIKSVYFLKASHEEYRKATVEQRGNPTPENFAKLKQTGAMFEKANLEVEKCGMKNFVNGSYPDVDIVLNDNNPGVSVYQYNYEYEVERFKEKKERYENPSSSEKVLMEEYQDRSDALKNEAVQKFGRFSKAARDYEEITLENHPEVQNLNSKISSAKDEYRLSPTYRKSLATKITSLNAEGKYKEADRMEAKLDVLTNLYNERQKRNKEVNENLKQAV